MLGSVRCVACCAPASRSQCSPCARRVAPETRRTPRRRSSRARSRWRMRARRDRRSTCARRRRFVIRTGAGRERSRDYRLEDPQLLTWQGTVDVPALPKTEDADASLRELTWTLEKASNAGAPRGRVRVATRLIRAEGGRAARDLCARSGSCRGSGVAARNRFVARARACDRAWGRRRARALDAGSAGSRATDLQGRSRGQRRDPSAHGRGAVDPGAGVGAGAWQRARAKCGAAGGDPRDLPSL